MSALGFTKRTNYSRCKNSAIYSLAMREHSRKELHDKLKRKDFAEDVDLNSLLDELEDSDYLSDKRFTESFIRYRITRGQGSVKIINELKLKGIPVHMINIALQEADIDWLSLARVQKEKKFGEAFAKDYKKKMKQMRFLFGRGFDSDVIRQVVDF